MPCPTAPEAPRGWRPAAAATLVLLFVVLAAAWLRLSALEFNYTHPDEVIPLAVGQAMLDHGTLDTNWARAPLPDEFRYPQYNFSGYILSAAAVLQLRAWWPGGLDHSALTWLRAWSALLGVASVALTFVLGRRLFSAAVGLVAACLVAVHPLLVQDALYARPETFVTVLTLLAVWLAAAAPAVRPERAFAAAVVLGLLVATKVSMLLLLPLLLLTLDAAGSPTAPGVPKPRALGYAWARGYPLPAGLLLGFVLGAPHAFMQLADFAEGVMALRTQYGSGHWPHGADQGTTVERLGYAARYFRTTTGWLLPVALAGAVIAGWRRQWRAVAVFLVALGTGLQFATYPVFFERNLSHVVPLFALFAALALVTLCQRVSQRPLLRVALLGSLTLALLWPALRTTATLRWHELPGVQQAQLAALRSRLERQLGVPATPMPWTQDQTLVRKRSGFTCGPVLIELPSAEEKHSRALIEQLRRLDGFAEVGRLPSAFAHVPPSTLHTYFTPTVVFLYRGTDADACWRQGGGLVPRELVGERLPVRAIDADPAWTRGGGFQVPADPFGGTDYFGSWSGQDAHRGRLRLTVSVEQADFIVLPYRTGPSVRGLSIRLVDADSGSLLLQATPPRSDDWQLPAVRVSPNTRTVQVEVLDEGADWGQWLAIGLPRGLR